MIEQAIITSCCYIGKNRAVVNGEVISVEENFINFVDFLKYIYRIKEIRYPKFFKMDTLCKIAFLAAELTIRDSDFLDKYKSENTAIVLETGSSSLLIDLEHQQTISDKSRYFPSPAVFVYTLPNIMLGEIAIRNKIQGECNCFVTQDFEPELLVDSVSDLLVDNKAECCITGWVEAGTVSSEVLLFLVEKQNKTDKKEIFNIQNTDNLYKNWSK
jgi:3-oxoacyl-(acyl-carrier-protein) synthase